MDVSINGARVLGYINVPLFGDVQITQTLTAEQGYVDVAENSCAVN